MRVRPRETPRWTLTELAAELDAVATSEAIVTGISLNTKHLEQGDLYAALQGANSHGAAFAGVARDLGASAVLTDSEGSAIVDELPMIVVDDPRRVLAKLSSTFYENPSDAFTTVGITGTQGKTTTTYLAEAALGERVVRGRRHDRHPHRPGRRGVDADDPRGAAAAGAVRGHARGGRSSCARWRCRATHWCRAGSTGSRSTSGSSSTWGAIISTSTRTSRTTSSPRPRSSPPSTPATPSSTSTTRTAAGCAS